MVIFMKYISIKDAAEKWDITPRRVQYLCKEGYIAGVQKHSGTWMIPEDAQKPVDGRTKEAKASKETNGLPHLPMPRKAPFLDMTDLYSVPGTADKCIEGLSDNPEAQKLFAAEIAYSRGEIDEVLKSAKYFLNAHSGFYAVNAGGMLLALAAMWKGDTLLWKDAKKHICEAPCKEDNDRDIMALSLACINTAIRDLSDYPEWFKTGCFGDLPPESHPSARVFYIKYMAVFAQELAKGEFTLPDVQRLGLMKTLPYLIEPMIVQSIVDKTLIPEIYLRLIVAAAYYNIGEKEKAVNHIDKAIEQCLPDKLLGILAEHRRQFDSLLDERLKIADKKAYNEYVKLHKTLLSGWTKLHNTLLNKRVSTTLSSGEREVARLAAFGLRDKEIAQRLNISVNTVKSRMTGILDKTGASFRSELSLYI